ncbi:hypothetical protein NDN08_005127 [Rhodosorus marinus]|uniref:Amidophosphoribosyltransferase n=1 Tax=Rhodosorus marinus TaxID=101924 RepID=A0AAV8V0L4_9RHOD|nr:hypothetical protein NDN08_005127 [Rhodosorus marinus]
MTLGFLVVLGPNGSRIRTSTCGRARVSCSAGDDNGPTRLETEVVNPDDDKLKEECGVFGAWGVPDAARACYYGIHALQHRGQEGAGIVASDGEYLKEEKGLGLVSEVFNENLLQSLPGSSAIAHNRYSTAGGKNVKNVQPFTVDFREGQVSIAHNGNLTNAAVLRSELELRGSIFTTSSDTEVVLHLMAGSVHASRSSQAFGLQRRVADALNRVEGAFSILVLVKDRLVAVRDPFGFRPLVMGRLGTGVVFASETSAFDIIGAESVYMSRYRFGEILAGVSQVDADIVVPVPESGIPSALGYAQASGIPFQMAIMRSSYVGRTFIQPTQSIRDIGVKLKLSPVRELIEGKSLVVVDDSIVRGTTSRKIVRMLRECGAREIHVRIACPPIIGSCYYGVDTPDRGELISFKQTVEETRDYIGADSLAYLPLNRLQDFLGAEAATYCFGCFSANYPVLPLDADGVEMEIAPLDEKHTTATLEELHALEAQKT